MMKQRTRMSIITGMAMLVVAGAIVATAAEVHPGDTLQEVKYALGNPRGQVVEGEHVVLMYDRGTVDLYQGYVVKVDLVSPEAVRERHAREAVAEAARARAAEEKQRRLQREGEEELARVLADESFKEKSGAEQVAFWEEFMRKYPGVIVADHYAAAQAKRDEEKKAEEEELAKKREEEAAQPPPPILSSRKKRKARRAAGLDPKKPVVTAPYTPPFERLGSPQPEPFTPPPEPVTLPASESY